MVKTSESAFEEAFTRVGLPVEMKPQALLLWNLALGWAEYDTGGKEA